MLSKELQHSLRTRTGPHHRGVRCCAWACISKKGYYQHGGCIDKVPDISCFWSRTWNEEQITARIEPGSSKSQPSSIATRPLAPQELLHGSALCSAHQDLRRPNRSFGSAGSQPSLAPILLFFSNKVWLQTVLCGSAPALSRRLLNSFWRKTSSSCLEVVPINVRQGHSGTSSTSKALPRT